MQKTLGWIITTAEINRTCFLWPLKVGSPERATPLESGRVETEPPDPGLGPGLALARARRVIDRQGVGSGPWS